MQTIKTAEPKVLWKLNSILGEGTLWVKEHNSIYFVDIKKKRIHILNIKNQKRKTIYLNKQIGFLAHIKKNIFILGLERELRIIDLKSKKIIKSIKIENNLPKKSTLNRKNSNLFGSISNKFSNYIDIGYDFSLDNNYNTFEYNDFNATISINNFVTSFDFIEQRNELGSTHLISNLTEYKINETTSLKFSTRRNKEINFRCY